MWADIGQRIDEKSFKSTHHVTSVDQWEGSKITEQVTARELPPGQKYKSNEERILHRLQSWTEVCTIKRKYKSKTDKISTTGDSESLSSSDGRLFHIQEGLFYNRPNAEFSSSTTTGSHTSCPIRPVRSSNSSTDSSSCVDGLLFEVEQGERCGRKGKRKMDIFTFGRKIQNSLLSKSGGGGNGGGNGGGEGGRKNRPNRSKSAGRKPTKKGVAAKSMENLTDETYSESTATSATSIGRGRSRSIFNLESLKDHIPKLNMFSNKENSQRQSNNSNNNNSNSNNNKRQQYCHTDSLSRRRTGQMSKSLDGNSFLFNVKLSNDSWCYQPPDKPRVGYI